MDAETGNNKNKKKIFRKPNGVRWTATVLVITYAVWCILMLVLAASGTLLKNQGFECVNSKEEASFLENKARLVYLWSGFSLLFCTLQLLECWVVKGFTRVFFLGSGSLFVIMTVTFILSWKEEIQEIKEFEERYLALLPLRQTPGNTHNQIHTMCHKYNTVYRWQAEYKCCGLQGYRDWTSSIPDSCLCDGEKNSSGCVEVGNSLVYEKPCLPTVLLLVKKQTSTFWTIMIVWMTIVDLPVAVFTLFLVGGCLVCCSWMTYEEHGYKLSNCIYRMRGGEEMVPAVFIRNNNNNQTEEENGKESGSDDAVALDVEGGTNAEGEGREAEEEDLNDNPVMMIPRSELKRLQELDPPPVRHRVKSGLMLMFSSITKNFYTVLIKEDSPLLPSGAVLVDPNKPTKYCFWKEGPHIFEVNHIVWPTEQNSEGGGGTPP